MAFSFKDFFLSFTETQLKTINAQKHPPNEIVDSASFSIGSSELDLGVEFRVFHAHVIPGAQEL